MKKLTTAMLASVLCISMAACSSNQPALTGEGESIFTGEYIVAPQYVSENIDNIMLIDARGEDAANDETIDGALAITWQYLSTAGDGATGDANWGCILDVERLSERLSEKGIGMDSEIVLFASSQAGWGDDGRIAWELIAAGYDNVKMVDGGFAGLKAAGLPTAKGGAKPEAVEVTVTEIDETHVINTDELVASYDDFKIVDVRATEEYEGATLYGEEKGGHLPGAISIKFTDLFSENGYLKSNDEITEMFTSAGLSADDEIVTYCTAGIRSAYMQLVMDMCGFENTQNYDESYYRWCAVQEVE